MTKRIHPAIDVLPALIIIVFLVPAAADGRDAAGEDTTTATADYAWVASDAAYAAEDSATAADSPLAAMAQDSIPAAAQDSAAVDSALAAAGGEEADTTEVDIFRPVWTSNMEADDSELKLGSGMSVKIEPGGGWILNNTTRVRKRIFRLRKTDELTQELSASAMKIDPELYTFNFRVGESYTRKTLVGLARFGKDLVIDTESAMMSFVMQRPVFGARSSQVAITGNARRGLNDFKYDRTLGGGASAYLRYGIGDSLKVSGGFGASVKREESEIGSTIAFDAMPSNADTIRADIGYGVGAKRPFHLAYSRWEGVKRMVAPPRGNSLEILDDPESAKEEEERNVAQNIELTSFLRPLSYVSVELSFKHREQEQKNKVDTRLNSDTEGTKLDARVTYDYSSRGTAAVDIENEVRDADYGPVSLGSNREKDKRVGMSVRHRITDSLSVGFSGSVSLKQRFLKKREQNPRDRDILFYTGGANMSASPFPGVGTTVNFMFNRRETINIDKTLSSDNRIDYLYQFKPSLRLDPKDWVTVTQDYMLKFESTEFVFDEDNNSLDRTIGVETGARFTVRRKIGFSFQHEYRMRDSGSYLWRGDERKYNRTGENIDNNLSMRLNYKYSEDFLVRGAARFNTQESNRLRREGGRTVVVSSSTYESGEFRVGFDRKRSIGAGGVFDLTIDYVRRYGPNVSAERREYWVVDAELQFIF